MNLIGPTDKISMDTTKDGRSVGTKLELNDDNSVYFSFGEYKENEYESLNEKIEKGVIMIDEDRGIYYVIDVDISF